MPRPTRRQSSILRLALMIALLLGAEGCLRPEGEGLLELDEAVIVPSDSTEPPRQQVGARQLSLPDAWGLARRSRRLAGWYLLEFQRAEAPASRVGLYLPSFGNELEVWLNDRRLARPADVGRFAWPMPQAPLLVELPVDLLRSGQNTLALRLEVKPESPGFLRRGFIGPLDSLRAAMARHELWAQWVPLTLAFLSMAFALLMVLVYRGSELMGASGWLASGICVWALFGVGIQVGPGPLPSAPVTALLSCAIHWWPLCFAIGMRRILEVGSDRRERQLLWVWAAFSLLQLMVTPLYSFVVNMTWALPAVAVGIYMVALLWRASQRAVLSRGSWLWIPVLIVGVLFASDLWALAFRQSPFGYVASSYALPVFTIVAGGLFFARLRDALHESRQLNRELEERIEEKRQELAENYDRLRGIEREQAAVTERERIMRDMHDGIGGELVSTLAMVESGRSEPEAIANALRDSLDDLRLMVNSLDPEAHDLGSMLALVRERLEPRLARQGLQFRWEVGDLPDDTAIGSQEVLQVMRIVQEAITNVVKHAGASTITVGARPSLGAAGVAGVEVEVRDDGRGFEVGRRAGRGLGNMRKRAEELGGSLEILSEAAGSRIRLWIPLASGGTLPSEEPASREASGRS